MTKTIHELEKIASGLRLEILDMVIRAKGGHIGGSFSVIDTLTVLYMNILNHDPQNPSWESRDRLLFSKGHSCLALYTVLAECGYFKKKLLEKYAVDEGAFAGHPEREFIPGVEITAGSLGHGHSLGVGMALAGKIDSKDYRVFVVSSDGELNEGSTWEAIMSASQYNLDNLTIIIDYNKYISLGTINSIMNIDPLKKRFESFGWAVNEIDGHNMGEIVSSLEKVPFKKDKPSAIIAHTIKGKGVSFMENVPMWHFRAPSPNEALQAKNELEKAYKK
jgi:transketolase